MQKTINSSRRHLELATACAQKRGCTLLYHISYVSNLGFFFQDSFVVPLLLVLSSLQNHTTRILQFKYIKFLKYVLIEIAMITKRKTSIFLKQRRQGRIKRNVQVAFSQTSKFFSVKARFNFVDLNSHCA